MRTIPARSPLYQAQANRLWRRFVSIPLLLPFLSLLIVAQQADTAVIMGSILDPNRSSVTTATVTLTHLGTNAVTRIHVDENGRYRTPPLRLGAYFIKIEASGFKRSSQGGVVLNMGDIRQVDVVLQVGEVSESVTVEAPPPLLQTEDSTVGTVITNRQIQELPLNGRDYLQLAALSSGTTPSANNGVGISIGGQAGSQTAFLLDGLDNNNQQISTGHSNQKEIVKPSVDAIQEFKVVTNGYSAEYGRSSSGVVSVALKSGTNQLHGVAYEFLRNDALDAKNYFAIKKSPYKRNQFGAAVGGPVIRDKIFFFGDFEIGKIRQSNTVVSTLPTLAQRTGQFSSKIIDPATGAPFAGNQIPLQRIDPVAQRILSFLPAPQGSSLTNNYVYDSPQNSDPVRWDFRIDQILSDKQNLFFRYSAQTTDNGVSSALPPDPRLGYYASGPSGGETGARTTDIKSFVLSYNRIWTPNLVSSIHAGWNYLFWNNFFPSQKLTGLGIPGVDESNPGFSNVLITGYPSLGVSNVPNSDGSEDRQLSGDLSWNKGRHNLKFGVQAYWLQTNFLSSQRTGGIFNFNGQYTNNALADFLLGDSSSASVSKSALLQFRAPYAHLFVQDDWKTSRHLTLNIGLRYEISPPAVEKHNRIANFDLDTTPGQPQLVLAGSQGGDRASLALQGVSYHQFAPRFGFAYSLPDSKTVIRGGYGIFYSNFITLGGMQSMEINPPNHVRISLSTDKTKPPDIFLSQGFPANILSLGNARAVTLVSYDRRNVTPTAQEWNLDIQRELPGGILLEVGYSANKFDHNWWQIDGNPATPGPGNLNSRRPYTSTVVPGTPYSVSLADVVRIEKDGYSRYNALRAKAEKRYAKGLTFIVSYAYSKTIGAGDTSGLQDPLNWTAERAASSQDMTHHFVGSAVYELPFGKGKQYGSHRNGAIAAFLGGWSIDPIVTANTGMPLNLSVNGNPSNTGQADRPNVVGDWHLTHPSVSEWFNTTAFLPNAPYTYGNAGRNLIRGPGLFDLDLAAHKAFSLTERVSAQLRLESFNLTNTPAFGPPNTQVGNPSFGQISSAGTARDNQIGLKIIF